MNGFIDKELTHAVRILIILAAVRIYEAQISAQTLGVSEFIITGAALSLGTVDRLSSALVITQCEFLPLILSDMMMNNWSL